jgi:transposase
MKAANLYGEAVPILWTGRGANGTTMNMSESVRKPRRHHDENFKRQAVAHWRNSGKSRKQVAQELGINHWVLRDWDRDLRQHQPVVPVTKTELEAENKQLRQELERVREQRDILKKTLGIISVL